MYQVARPRGLAVADGKVFVADSAGGRGCIAVFDATTLQSVGTFSGAQHEGTASSSAEVVAVDNIVEVWREQSTRGRYEAAMWKEGGLEPAAEPEPESNCVGVIESKVRDQTSLGCDQTTL